METNDRSDIGLYQIEIEVSQDDGYGLLLSDNTEFTLEILPCHVESLLINQFPENFNYTIHDDALKLGTINISEQPACNYPQTIEFRVTKDGELVDRTFLTQDSEGIVTIWSDRPSDEGLYRVKIVVSQDDGFGVQISDYTEFVLDV